MIRRVVSFALHQPLFVVLGMILFNEARDVWRIVCLVMIISGVIGLKFLAPPETPALRAAAQQRESDG